MNFVIAKRVNVTNGRSLSQRKLFWLALFLLAASFAFAQSPEAASGGIVHGTVKAGSQPIPGVTVTAANTLTGQKVMTSTGVDGSFSLRVPANGRYVVRAQMAAFAPSTQTILVNSSVQNLQVNLELMLASRAEQAAQAEAKAEQKAEAAQGGRGFQSLSLSAGAGGEAWGGGSAAPGDAESPAGAAPGMSENSATESVAISGNTSNPMANMSGEEIRQRIQEFRQQNSGFASQAFGGGFGGFGGGGGGFGGIFRGGRGGFNVNQPHGSLYYSGSSDALDAAPFALPGQSSAKPSFLQNRFGASIGGPLDIPKIYNGGTKTFYFVNYNGSRGNSPFDEYSNVPTLAERNGDFSGVVYPSGPNQGLPVELFQNGAQVTNIPVSPAAQALLQYFPLPNQPAGSPQNFHFVSATGTSTDSLNVRLNRSFGAAATGQRRRGGPRNNLSFGFHYSASTSNLTNPFPNLGGNMKEKDYDGSIGYTRSFGKLTNSARVDFNRSRAETLNLFAFQQNVAGALGITGVSQNPFDWGVPNLSFTDLASLQDTAPSLQINQTLSFTDSMIWTYGKHTLRWGGDFRRLQFNVQADGNPRGSFVFTGINTAQIGPGGTAVQGTGFDFADFLLGLPQQTSVQYGANPLSTNNYHFRGNSWDWFVQDNWRARGNLTLSLGLRYEYVSPFSELNNQIATLDVSNTLNPAQVPVRVLPGQSGPYSGAFPGTLVRPDRNNFAPRLGLAWKVSSKTVVRTGYGINYNIGEYRSIAQDLAYQAPFATAQINVQTAPGDLTLQNGFPASAQSSSSNTYAINPNYRLGYVQMWDVSVQQEVRPTLLVNVDYTGSKGTALDILEEPNRTASGILWNGVSPFYLENSTGSSILHAGSLRVRKRLQNGVSIGGTYTFSKSLDNASSIGNGIVLTEGGGGFGGGFGGGGGGFGGGGGTGGAAVVAGNTSVAQNPADLSAERGLSSFDQRHNFTADYLWELPIGRDKRWLANGGVLAAIVGGWQWSGDWTIASGLPFTPRILGNFADVSRGTNGTLRPDILSGTSLSVPNPNIAQWFNVAAFTQPAAGTFGNARRNSIIGPGTIMFDMAMTKVFPLTEGKTMEFRVSADNIFNHPNYASIDTTLCSPTFGQVTSVGAMRSAEVMARFRF